MKITQQIGVVRRLHLLLRLLRDPKTGPHHVPDDPQILGPPALQQQSLERPLRVAQTPQQRDQRRRQRLVCHEERQHLRVTLTPYAHVQPAVDGLGAGERRGQAIVETTAAHHGGCMVERLRRGRGGERVRGGRCRGWSCGTRG